MNVTRGIYQVNEKLNTVLDRLNAMELQIEGPVPSEAPSIALSNGSETLVGLIERLCALADNLDGASSRLAAFLIDVEGKNPMEEKRYPAEVSHSAISTGSVSR